MIELNKIYCEDCLDTMAKMDDNSLDLVVTSPPYNKGWYAPDNAKPSELWAALGGRKIQYDVYKDEMPPEQYEAWQRKLIEECLRVLKPSGSLFYNHKDILSHGLSIVPKWVYDYNLHQQIVWDRGGSPMQDSHYFMPVNEWIYWIVKDPKKCYFNKKESAYRTNIWRVNTEKNPHPAPFPLKLINSIVAACSPENGVIYDPYMGSGSTAISTLKVGGGGRQYIGSEISANYVAMAEERIKIFKSEPTLF